MTAPPPSMPGADGPVRPDGRGRWSFPAACLLVGLSFFLTGQSLATSRSENFTQNEAEMEQTSRGGDLVRRAAFLTLGGLGAAVLVGGRTVSGGAGRERGVGWPAWFLAAHVLWCSLSLLWSDHPPTTVRRLGVLWCFLLAAAALARLWGGREVVRFALWVPAGYAVLGLLCEAAQGTLRPWEGDYRFSGTMHPNTQGTSLAVLCVAALMRYRETGRGRLLGVLAAAVTLLLFTKSRTSVAAVGLTVSALLFLGWGVRGRTAAVFAAGLGGLAVLLVSAGLGFDPAGRARGAFLMGREEQAASLTGRLPLWAELHRYADARPWFGAGYDTFWTAERIAAVSDELGWGLREAHNAYLDVWLSVGLTGLIPLAVGLLGAWWTAARRFARTGAAFPGFTLGVLTVALVNGLTESLMAMVLFPTFAVCVTLFEQLVFRGEDVRSSWKASAFLASAASETRH